MLTRPIPKTGEEMPLVGLGTWQVFDVGGGAARRPLLEVVRDFLDGGGKMIDTSPMYGRAEEVTGDLLAATPARERAFVATKVWTSGRERGIAQMARSARLLGCAVIDLMQIHNLVDWQTHLATLREMKARGHIRYIGITHYTAAAFEELADIIEGEPDIDFVQLPYSLATRAAENRLLSLAAAREVAVIVNRPLDAGGLFHRLRGRSLPEWALEFDSTSWAQLFLKYILAESVVTCVIPATGDPAHLEDNLAAGRGRLPDARQRQQIRDFWDAL
jgi:diketogulonate reductase-like aldo/keto reductase